MNLSLNSVSGYKISEIDKKFQYQQLGIPDDVISQGASAIEDYAYENSITLPDFEAQDEEALFAPSNDDSTQAAAGQNSGATNNEANKKLRYQA